MVSGNDGPRMLYDTEATATVASEAPAVYDTERQRTERQRVRHPPYLRHSCPLGGPVNPSDDLDLTTFVADALPAMVEVEAAEDWQGRSARPVLRPATSLTSEDSPLTAFLALPTEPPEGAGRSERTEFWEQRNAAEQAAREAVADALADHTGMVRARQQRAAADAFDALIAKGHEQVKRAESGERVPVKGPDQPADVGRW